MIKVIEIESALNRINGDIFQEFCNHFLFFKINPNSIDPIGSVIGKEKSRKGIPDCYFTSKDGELIFAEYTTKEKLERNQSFLNKLKQDINSCYDESKTGIKPNEIDKVILCFTDKLKPKERKELNSLCKKYNKACSLELYGIRDLSFAVLDYPLLGEYLGVKVGTGQILTPSEFITNYEKSKLSIPLSNQFFGRQAEIKTGLENLETYNILLIHGPPGTGKSKYAIELCSQFTQIHTNYRFLCIGNNRLPIWDDLQRFIRKDFNYVILVDDANRLAKNYQWILSLLDENKGNKIKIIVTVRDYAFTLVKNISSEFNYSTIEIIDFSKDDIKEIIKSKDFNIQNPAFIERIIAIAKGNARIAIMCAKVALESDNLLSLDDASQIYEEYFRPIFNEVKILSEQNTLKTLAIISFFGKIDKENREFCEKVFCKLNLDEDLFWETCYVLNENELVDLFESQIVKMTDQVFSTYIFYKAVIDSESLSFKFFLDNFLDYEYRIKDTIIPVINTFNYLKIEDKLKTQIVSKWHEVEQRNDHEQSLKYLDLFWYYLSPQVLVYCKKYIDSLDEPTVKAYRYSYEINEFSYGTEKIVDILSRFKLLKNVVFKDAMELLFYYALKIPNKLPAIIYTIKEKFSFTRFSDQYNDYIQHNVLDFLISKSQTGNEIEVFEKILLEIIPHYLKLEYHETTSEGREITLHTFHIWLSDSIKSFRKKCFDYLAEKTKHNKPVVLQTIYNLPIFEYKNSDEIYNFDKRLLFPIIEEYFDPEIFEDCFVFQELVEKLEIMKKEYPIKLKSKFKNKLYLLTEVLKSDKIYRKKEIAWEEEEKLHEAELIRYCKDFQSPEYIELFDNVSLILKKTKKNNIEWQFSRSLDIILGNIAKEDYNLFLEILHEYFKKYDFKINFFYIFNSFFNTNSKYYFELYTVIQNARAEIKLNFHHALIIDSVSSAHIELLYQDLKQTIQGIVDRFFFWDLTFIGKYAIRQSELAVYQNIIDAILHNIENNNAQISVGKKFIEKCMEIKNFPFDKIANAYFYSNKFEQHFDYNKKILKRLVEKDNKILIEQLRLNSPDRISYHDLEHENYDFVWELENYKEIVKSLIDFFLENKPYIFWERAINAFFPKTQDKYGDKPIQYLNSIIKEHSNNSKYIEVAFNIICYSFPYKRDELLKEFLMLNSDFRIFKKLELVKRGGVFTGSRIPYIENDIKSWKKVLIVLEQMPNRLDFIAHKEYVNRQINYCLIDKQREIKREFLDDYL